MGWTRHFYELEAVLEAFHTAAGAFKDPARKPKLAFWAYELWLSEEREELWGALRKAWWRWGEPDAVIQEALEGPAVGVAEEVLLVILGSLQSIRVPPAAIPPPRGVPAGTVWAEWGAEAKEALRRAVRDAVIHGRTERVLRLLVAHPLRVAAEILGIPYKVGNGLLQLLGVLGLRRGLGTAVSAAWPRIPVGRVGARLFCTRSSSGTPMEPSGLAVVGGCAFWRRELAERGCSVAASKERGHLVFPTEDAFEEFYGEFFPDDIPDEWSAAEREKSHSGSSSDQSVGSGGSA